MRFSAALLLLAAAASGCRSWPWRGGAVPKSVATCRDLSRQGMAAIEQGQWNDAEKLLGRAVDSCPVDVDARRQYAETLARRGAVEDAVRQLDEAVRLSDNDLSLAVRSGELYLELKRLDMAQKRAERALRIDPTSADAWALRGRIMEARGELRQALADLQRALGYRRDDRQLLSQIAVVYHKLDRPDRALVYWQALAETYPAGDEPQVVLVEQAAALGAMSRHADAAACYDQALRRGRPSPELLIKMAEACLAAGDPRQAQRAAQAAVELAPQDPAARALAIRLAAGIPEAMRR